MGALTLSHADRILAPYGVHLSRSPDDGSWATSGGLETEHAQDAVSALRAWGFEATAAADGDDKNLRWIYVTVEF